MRYGSKVLTRAAVTGYFLMKFLQMSPQTLAMIVVLVTISAPEGSRTYISLVTELASSVFFGVLFMHAISIT